MIKIKDFTFKFSNGKGLENINLKFEKGHLYGIVGTNGAGKTTLLKSIAGIYKSKGEIEVRNSSKYKSFIKNISFFEEIKNLHNEFELYQMFKLFEEEIYFDRDYFISNLKKFNLEIKTLMLPLINSIPKSKSTMSKGEIKIMNAIFTLSFKSEIYIFDEPISNVDIINKEKILKLILERSTEDNLIIISSHELNSLESKIDKAVIMENSKILETINIEEIRIEKNVSLTKYFEDKFKETGDIDD